MSNSALANDLQPARFRTAGRCSTRPSVALRLSVRIRAARSTVAWPKASAPTGTRLALRGRQLTSGRSRRSLAARSRAPSSSPVEPRRFGPAVPVDRRAVLEAPSRSSRSHQRLEDGAPTNPRGVAIVHELLTDGSSPLYASTRNSSDPSNGQL